jgi:hypothetical protein
VDRELKGEAWSCRLDCFIFATKLVRLDATKPFQTRINLDVRNAIDVGGGAIRAPKISGKLAEMRYGARP